jgi:hypothetical protein
LKTRPTSRRQNPRDGSLASDDVLEQVLLALRDVKGRTLGNDAEVSSAELAQYRWPVNFDSILRSRHVNALVNAIASDVNREGPDVLGHLFYQVGCYVAQKHGDHW